MIATPWGRSDELRTRRLRPGPGVPRADVEANQRERLFGAMVAAVAEHGYEKTRVADLLEVSGISRNTFYRLFSNKQECFLATLDALAFAGGEQILRVYLDHEGSWDELLTAAFDELIAWVLANPAAARLYYVEAYAAGPEAIERLDRAGDAITDLVRKPMDQSPDHAGMPRDLLRAILRGIRRVIQSRLRAGREQELAEVGPQLLSWALSYRTPPARLRRPRQPRHEFPVRSKDKQDPTDRILDAVILEMSEQGYAALTITQVASRASVSLSTFYDRFAGKDDAVVAAMHRSANRVVTTVAPAYQRAPDWPEAIGATLDAFFAYLQLEQPFARFGGVDVHSGSRLVVEVRDQLLAAGQAFVAEGYRQHPEANPIAGEAIGASIDALVFEQVSAKGLDRIYEVMPIATYLALVPFVGAHEACAIANASR